MLKQILTTRAALSDIAGRLLCEEVDGDLSNAGDVPIESITLAQLALDIKSAIRGAKAGDVIAIVIDDGNFDHTAVGDDEVADTVALVMMAAGLDPFEIDVSGVALEATFHALRDRHGHGVFTVAAFIEQLVANGAERIDDAEAEQMLDALASHETEIAIETESYRLRKRAGCYYLVPVDPVEAPQQKVKPVPLYEERDADTGDRQTFEVPPGWTAVLTPDGRATGKLMKLPSEDRRRAYPLLHQMGETFLLAALARAQLRYRFSAFGETAFAAIIADMRLALGLETEQSSLSQLYCDSYATLCALTEPKTPIGLPEIDGASPGWFSLIVNDGNAKHRAFKFAPAQAFFAAPKEGKLP